MNFYKKYFKSYWIHIINKHIINLEYIIFNSISMSKSKILLEKLTSLLAQGFISYKDLSNEVVNIVKSQRDEIILKMKISTKEETDILKRRIEKLENEISKLKRNKRIKKAKKS